MSRCGRHRWLHVAAALAGVLLLAASCQSQAAARAPTTVDVTMHDYRFALPDVVPAGRAVVQVRNLGTEDHELTLVPLPPDLPPLDEQLRGAERRPVTPLATLPAVAPGEGRVFAVDLTSGRYGLVCFLTDAGGQVHALQGMNTEITVR